MCAQVFLCALIWQPVCVRAHVDSLEGTLVYWLKCLCQVRAPAKIFYNLKVMFLIRLILIREIRIKENISNIALQQVSNTTKSGAKSIITIPNILR